MAKTAPGAYAESIREAVKNGARPDQALKYAMANVAMEVIAERVPVDELLGRAAGDPKRAAGIMDAVLKQYGIRMTGEELGWLGRVTAEASKIQRQPGFAKAIALQMLTEKTIKRRIRRLVRVFGSRRWIGRWIRGLLKVLAVWWRMAYRGTGWIRHLGNWRKRLTQRWFRSMIKKMDRR